MTEPMRAWTAETLIDAYGDELLRLCLLYLGDRQLAEDAFQETMVKAWRALPGFRGESGAKTWLFHIAVNTCRDMLRTGWMRMRRRSVPLEVMPELDILYMTRVQKERFFNEEDYLRLKDSYILTPEKLKNAKSDLRILHPLPRVNEISVAVDEDPRACYFKQVQYGKYIRMALILKLLNIA